MKGEIIQFRRMRGDTGTNSKGVMKSDVMHLVFPDIRQSHLVKDQHCTNLVGLIVGHQLVDGRGLGDLQQDGLGLLSPLRRPRAHVAEVTGARTLALAGAVHADAGCHALRTRVQQTGDVCRVGQRSGLLVALL